jgi:hypothetical protein
LRVDSRSHGSAYLMAWGSPIPYGSRNSTNTVRSSRHADRKLHADAHPARGKIVQDKGATKPETFAGRDGERGRSNRRVRVLGQVGWKRHSARP